MANSGSDEKQAQKAATARGLAHACPSRGRLGYRSIYPVRKMEGTKLHPARETRGWVFDPAEVATLKTARAKPSPTGLPLSEGRLAARVFYLFDHGRELREIVEDREVAPKVVRDLWHEWLVGVQDGEIERRAIVQQECHRKAEEKEMQALDRRSVQEQRNFETTMATIAASIVGGKDTK
jgi:hypothetical protein